MTLTRSVAFALLALLALCWASEAHAQAGKRMAAYVETKTVSLKDLVAYADRIFVGEVTKVEQVKQKLGPDSDQEFPVEEVTFAVKTVIKAPPPKPGANANADASVLAENKPYKVRRSPSIGRPLKQGETVLWYLAKESDIGLSQPVGIASGDFSVTDAGAINQKANAGLISQADVDAVRTAAEKVSKILPPNQQNNFVTAASTHSQTLSQVTGGGKPVPLDGLVSSTRLLIGGGPP